MKELILSQGKVALVDNNDFEIVNQWKWHLLKSKHTDYAVRQILTKMPDGSYKYRNVYLHRIIMNPENGLHIDHINHNGLDNRRVNLRIVTCRENHWNRKKENGSGYVGAYKYLKRFQALIEVNGKLKYIGTYDTAKEANRAYMDAVDSLNV